MNKALIITIALFFCSSVSAQRYPTAKELYQFNCKAVVQIQAGNSFGVGFIISPDGTILTANHVVTTEESGFRQYATSIKVLVDLVNGGTQEYDATPVSKEVSDDQVNFDTAAIKLLVTNVPGGLASFAVGDWKTVEVGDQVTILTKWPGMGCLLLDGAVAAKSGYKTPLGPKPVDTLIFQSPIRRGFSGSPIINSHAEVVAIETTKVFGISPALAALRDQLEQSKDTGARIFIAGSDPVSTNIEVINNLDQNLISGLGSGVSIEYGKNRPKW